RKPRRRLRPLLLGSLPCLSVTNVLELSERSCFIGGKDSLGFHAGPRSGVPPTCGPLAICHAEGVNGAGPESPKAKSAGEGKREAPPGGYAGASADRPEWPSSTSRPRGG